MNKKFDYTRKPDRTKLMLEMYSNNLTLQEIADIFDVSKQRVHFLIKNKTKMRRRGKRINR